MIFIRVIVLHCVRCGNLWPTLPPSVGRFATLLAILLDKRVQFDAELSDESLEQLCVPVQAFKSDLAAPLHIIDRDLKSHGGNRRVVGHVATASFRFLERQTFQEHLSQGEWLLIHRCGNSLLHLDDLEFSFARYETEYVEHIMR